MPSVKNPIFGNAAKIVFLHKLLLRVSKLLVGTVNIDLFLWIFKGRQILLFLRFLELIWFFSTEARVTTFGVIQQIK